MFDTGNNSSKTGRLLRAPRPSTPPHQRSVNHGRPGMMRAFPSTRQSPWMIYTRSLKRSASFWRWRHAYMLQVSIILMRSK